MLFEHYLLLILAILPLIYKYSFWLYTIQLKEYRWDRFKEYISTPQGNSAIINIWTILEFPLFLISLIIFFDSPFEIIIYNVMFVFLLIQNLFVIRKIIKRKIIKPKFTGRLLLILSLIIIGFSGDLSFIILNEIGNTIYSYILFVYLFSPLVIFFIILILSPIVSYIKNKKIKKAIDKTTNITHPIKIGITGSYGKSSIKEFLSSILLQDGKTLKTPENINTELGVSSVIIKKLDKTYKYFIAEMGAYKRGEIDVLGRIVNHKYGFLTAIGNQHIGLFGSQKNIRKGKSEIANSVLKNKGVLYINWDNKEVRNTNFDKNLNTIRYGSHKGVDANFKIIEIKKGITEFNFKYKKNDTVFKTDLIGEHNIINITGVIAFCYDLGLKTTEIKKYLKKIKSPNNTLQIIKTKTLTLIDDTYNLSEASIFSGLNVLNSFEGNKILVIDDILELGSISKEFHYQLAKDIIDINKNIKIMYVGINYKKYFLNGLMDGGYNNKNIIHTLINIKKDSTILFEGRNAKKYLDDLK